MSDKATNITQMKIYNIKCMNKLYPAVIKYPGDQIPKISPIKLHDSPFLHSCGYFFFINTSAVNYYVGNV